MPRIARIVYVGVPHHITQRGNRRGEVFFNEQDRRIYLDYLLEYSQKAKLDILAYCLMTNHIHLVAIPNREDSLEQVFRPLHTRYALRINRRFGWKGHLWQGRFFSNPLDEEYMWAAIRYTERNPVRAKMVGKAQDYPWSSAQPHCGLSQDKILTDNPPWQDKGSLAAPSDWLLWLSEEGEPEKLNILRRNINKGLPCGSDTFIKRLEKITGCFLNFRPQGRPKNKN